VNEEKPKRFVDVLKISIKSEGNRKKENDVRQKLEFPHKDNKDEFIRYFPPRWPHTMQYQNSFFGYWFSYNHFCHKEIYCRAHERNDFMWKKNISTYGSSNRNYNYFSPLFD